MNYLRGLAGWRHMGPGWGRTLCVILRCAHRRGNRGHLRTPTESPPVGWRCAFLLSFLCPSGGPGETDGGLSFGGGEPSPATSLGGIEIHILRDLILSHVSRRDRRWNVGDGAKRCGLGKSAEEMRMGFCCRRRRCCCYGLWGRNGWDGQRHAWPQREG